MTTATISRMQDEVKALARERDAVILAHNYQVPEVQDVADYVGDSLGLSREAADTDAVGDRLLRRPLHGRDGEDPLAGQDRADPRPRRRLLARRLDHGRPAARLEGRAPRRGRRLLREHDRRGEGRVRLLLHVRQREGDHRRRSPRTRRSSSCPTSTSASGWRRSRAASSRSGWASATSTRASARPTSSAGRRRRPTPSCSSTPSAAARASAWPSATSDTHILSTEGMIRFAKQSPKERFLVATETGILHRLRKEVPEQDASRPSPSTPSAGT